MTGILIDSCDVVVTMDDRRTEIPHASILVGDGVIKWIGHGTPPASEAAERIDARGCVALPGLINTHHHMFQALTRACAQDQNLFGWIRHLSPLWVTLDEEWYHTAARVAMAELALSGGATTVDHHTVFPARSDALSVAAAAIGAAEEVGLRFHFCRGSIDRGVSKGGIPPDEMTQDTDAILVQTEETIKRFHDSSPGSMVRVAVAPASPFTTTKELMAQSAQLARRLQVRLHTHIAETREEGAYCLETYGRHPVQLLDELGWLASDVWLAHCVHIDKEAIRRFAQTSSGVAWCPSSNLRLGTGIAPARALLDARVRVGLGVDGSASNDAGHMLGEVRMGMLAARYHGATAMSAREVLWVATRGGASVLGRDDIGALEVGKRADIAIFGVDGLEMAGADADLVAGLAFCAPQRVRHLLVNGRQIVRNGRLVKADEEDIAARGHRAARQIAARLQ
jgi:cytosine/adenosine deaminase-related metal-dependent hydrolase